VEWHEDKELLGRFLPRRGYRTQPRVETLGFNPGNLKINEFALKGRDADKINLAPIAG
jgi:hypothetical protein